jgi:hypothetical protein
VSTGRLMPGFTDTHAPSSRAKEGWGINRRAGDHSQSGREDSKDT